MLAFISYQTEDRFSAAAISDLLKSFDIEAFMAHEHIEVSAIWRDEIIAKIAIADIFVAILSKNYLSSHWCIQEAGIAAFRNVPVIPLSLDKTIPPGFLGHIQATAFDPKNFTSGLILPAMATLHLTYPAT